VPEFGEGTSSTAEAKKAAPTVESAEESTVVPKVPTVGPAKPRMIWPESQKWKK
jgi:hypothetical protein